MRNEARIAMTLVPAALILTLAGCGNGESSRQAELQELRQKVSDGAPVEQRLVEVLSEVVSLRTELRGIASDPLLQDQANLKARIQDTGKRLGLQVARIQAEEVREGEVLRWQMYRVRIRGRVDVLDRWLHELVNWPIVLHPVRLVSQDDPLSSYQNELRFALPSWTMPPEAPRPGDPQPPPPEPEGDVEHEIWRLRQNLARIELVREALSGVEAERDALRGIVDRLEQTEERSRVFRETLSAVLDAGRRVGTLQGIVVGPDRIEATAVVPTQQAGQALIEALSAVDILEGATLDSSERTRLGIRVTTSATMTGRPVVPAPAA